LPLDQVNGALTVMSPMPAALTTPGPVVPDAVV
jgi:hypothetical protein